MTSALNRAFALAACLIILPAASRLNAQKVEATEADELSDRVISLAVENELLGAEAMDAHRIDATATDGIVILSGKVDNLLARSRASKLAQQVKGVLTVVNQIFVIPGERKDERIAEDIRQAWSAEEVTESRQLEVEVNVGTATLAGSVESPAEKSLARRIAAGVSGVVAIENDIEVIFGIHRSDEEIREDVQGLIDAAVELEDAEIEVDVQQGMVILNGWTGSAFGKAVAQEKSWIGGVEAVDARGVKVDYQLHDGTRRHQRMQEVTDETIVEAIKRALRHAPRTLSYLETIEVASDAGSVTLSGTVGRLRAKEAAEEVARSTVGVWRVKDHLKVRWLEETPAADEIIDHVQTAFRRDPYIARHTVRVHCRNAHVSLYGIVDSEFEREVAGWIAGGQKGVVHVNNQLAVAKRWEPKSDAEIKADIEEKLKFTFFDKSNDIDVTVEDGVAVLRGEVDTWLAWQTAMDKAIEAGARRPHNLLKVRYHPRHGSSRIYVPR